MKPLNPIIANGLQIQIPAEFQIKPKEKKGRTFQEKPGVWTNKNQIQRIEKLVNQTDSNIIVAIKRLIATCKKSSTVLGYIEAAIKFNIEPKWVSVLFVAFWNIEGNQNEKEIIGNYFKDIRNGKEKPMDLSVKDNILYRIAEIADMFSNKTEDAQINVPLEGNN
jgi:hypothetical protein